VKKLRSVSINYSNNKKKSKTVKKECSKETARISFYLMWGKGIGGTAPALQRMKTHLSCEELGRYIENSCPISYFFFT
jgi:hypothetical protein